MRRVGDVIWDDRMRSGKHRQRGSGLLETLLPSTYDFDFGREETVQSACSVGEERHKERHGFPSDGPERVGEGVWACLSSSLSQG